MNLSLKLINSDHQIICCNAIPGKKHYKGKGYLIVLLLMHFWPTAGRSRAESAAPMKAPRP